MLISSLSGWRETVGSMGREPSPTLLSLIKLGRLSDVEFIDFNRSKGAMLIKCSFKTGV